MRTVGEVAWFQLSYQKMKLAVAVAGVIVSVMLMLTWVSIRQGAMDNSVALIRRMEADLIMVSPRTKTIFQSAQQPRRLLYRLPSDERVEEVREVYIALARWRSPWDFFESPLNVYGIDPLKPMLNLPGLEKHANDLHQQDRYLYDAMSRSKYGPVKDTLAKQPDLEVELNGRKVRVVGVIHVGISIGNDGNVYTSHENFLRLFPNRAPGSIDLGLIKLKPGVSAKEARDALQPLLGKEANLICREDLKEAEVNFMRQTAPIDFIFGMGATVGFFIGAVVVYQILYTEVTNNLPQLATLKAIGFTDFYLQKLVLWQAYLLATLGYPIGLILAIGLLHVAEIFIQMPLPMTVTRAVWFYAITLCMCGLSAVVAVRKAVSADPAEVF